MNRGSTAAGNGTGTPRRVSLAASGAVLVLVLAVTLSRSFCERIAADVFFSLTLASFVIVFLSVSVRPTRDALQLAGTASVLVGLQILILRVPFKVLPAVAMLGMSGFVLEAMRRIWSGRERSQLVRYALLPPLLLVLAGYFGSALLELTGRLHPRTLDLLLYSFDQSLGVQLSCKVGQFVLPSRALTKTAVGLYYALPLPLMFVYARQLLRDRNFALTAFLAFLITGPLGVVFYNLVPACGPIYLLGSRFPFEPLSLQQVGQLSHSPEAVAGIRNAFPSLHLCWALLIWWYSKGLSWWARLPLLLFLAGTGLAILGVGEHYFVDLVAAFPLALMIEAGCALQVPILDRRRLWPFLTGLILMLGWVVLLRSGMPAAHTNPIIPWLLIVGTIAVCLILHARLQVAVIASSRIGAETAAR